MSEARKVRAVLCIADPTTREAMHTAIEHCGFFEVVGEAKNQEELGEALHMEYPDFVILDTAISGREVQSFLLEASAGRPVPALLLTAEESSKRRKRGSRWKLTRLGKDVLLRTDLLARNHVWARLIAVADQLTASKHTQTSARLDQMIKAERIRARHSGHRTEVIGLATWPLDLIVLTGGRGCNEVLTSLVAKIGSMRVPVLVAVNGENPVDTRRLISRNIHVQTLEAKTELRRSDGVYVAPQNGVVQVGPETIDLEETFDPLSAPTTVTSCASLRTGVLAVLLSDDETETAMALGSVLSGGGLVACLDPAEAPAPEGPAAAASWEITSMTLRIDELAWVIEHAVPRRA